MKIVEAVWEKRNLGVTCAEIEVAKTDDVTEVVNAIRQRKEQYLVLKLAPGRVDLSFAIQEEGFRYIETMFETASKKAESFELPELCRSLDKEIGYRWANDADIERVLNEIRKGDLFSTDRIALDPAFSKQLAGRRYAYWMQDVFKRGNASMAITSYDHIDIGFGIHVDKGHCHELLLGGIFSEYQQSGLGLAHTIGYGKALDDEGVVRTVSHVSSNNPGMLKINLMSGGHIRSMKYVYIKHQ